MKVPKTSPISSPIKPFFFICSFTPFASWLMCVQTCYVYRYELWSCTDTVICLRQSPPFSPFFVLFDRKIKRHPRSIPDRCPVLRSRTHHRNTMDDAPHPPATLVGFLAPPEHDLSWDHFHISTTLVIQHNYYTLLYGVVKVWLGFVSYWNFRISFTVSFWNISDSTSKGGQVGFAGW